MTGSPAPEALVRIAETWSPPAQVTEGELTSWPGRALAQLLGTHPPEQGDPLPPLWWEVHLRTPYALPDLAEDGHARGDALLPPIPGRRRMFGGGRITTSAPLRVGEHVVRSSRVARTRLREGRSGWLLVVTEEHRFEVDGRDRLREERDLVYRAAGPAADPAAGPAADAGARGEDAPVSTGESPRESDAPTPDYLLEPDERLLFCFSALTYNPHRIHYDRRFCTEVEGHRDLLVHGPLLALGALEAARASAPDPITSFDYRLVAPAYVGQPVRFDVTRGEITATQQGVVCLRSRSSAS